MSGFDATRKQHCFPILVWLEDSLHGEQMSLVIFKHETGHAARRREFLQPAQAERFAVDARGIAEPIGRDAQFRQ